MEPERFAVPVTAHLILVQGDRVLLSRRCNTGYADGLYSVVAGHLDGGEEVVVAAIREAREEAGIVIAPADLAVVGVMHRLEGDERVDFFLAASRWAGEAVNAEPHKCAELAWHPLDRLPEDIVPYVRLALDRYRRAPGRLWFESLGWPGTNGL
ncbi:MAG TPA: NUDIX domain-containing protein [Thermomicrobiales bacterium]|nr:NUDIX domain-containing protein [Thermomicrobiales bacterium]